MKHAHGKWIVATLTASIWLTGCGGGGGGSSSTPTAESVGYTGLTAGVAMTDLASADAIASDTIAAAVNLDLTDLTSGYMKSGTADSLAPELASFTQVMIDRAQSLASTSSDTGSTLLAGLTQTDTKPCAVSGSISYSVAIADENFPFQSAGDSISMTANSCDDGFGTIGNGTFSMVVKSYADNPTNSNLTAQLGFSNVTETSITSSDYFLLNGGLTMSMSMDYATGAESYSMSGDALLVAESVGGTVSQHALTGFSMIDTIDAGWNLTADHDFTFYSTDIGGSVTVNTTTPIFMYYADLYPSSGVVVITGAENAKVRVTALDNISVRLDYDLDADGEFGDTDADDPASQTKLWTEL